MIADEIDELRERMREAAKLNMGLMEIRRANEAEIERLRETIEAMSIYNGTQHGEIVRLKAEIKRLRELLRDVDDGLDDYWVITKDGVSWIRRRSEALGE